MATVQTVSEGEITAFLTVSAHAQRKVAKTGYNMLSGRRNFRSLREIPRRCRNCIAETMEVAFLRMCSKIGPKINYKTFSNRHNSNAFM